MSRAVSTSLLLSLMGTALTGVSSAQGYLAPPPAPPENPVTAEKAVLGKLLFWDEQLSSDGSMACGTCHIPSVGGAELRTGPSTVFPGPDGVFGTADDGIGSPGVVNTDGFGHFAPSSLFGLEPQVTGRYAPSPITAGYFPDLFWDGRASSKFIDPLTGATAIASGGALESQSLGPLLSDVEMAEPARGFADLSARIGGARPLALATDLPADVQAALQSSPTYQDLFTQAFGTADITPVRIAFALATYQRTLVADRTPWDDFQRGITGALTPEQQRGMVAFETTAACAVCHTPPLFANGGYHSIALRPSSEDIGRAAVTGYPWDEGKFKTPSLRNVALRNHWFHNGSPAMSDLRDTVAVYGTGVGGGFDNLDPVLNGLILSPAEVDDITEFLHALTDPRVAAESYPFDRPTLRIERAVPNPEPLGVGAVAGSGGQAPELILTPAPFLGSTGFRVGVTGGLGGAFGAMRLRVLDLGGFPGAASLRSLPLPGGPIVLNGVGPGEGYATWNFPLTSTPALLGLKLEGQWWVRDAAAPGGVARSERFMMTVE